LSHPKHGAPKSSYESTDIVIVLQNDSSADIKNDIMTIVTRVSRTKKGTKSLKTTIPESISEFMEISDKDEIQWKMHLQNNIRLAIVQKKAG
jgi:predicted GNAT superfamily acetyltransferase